MASLDGTFLSYRLRAQVNPQQNSRAWTRGGSTSRHTGRQRPSRDERMLSGTGTLIERILVEKLEDSAEVPGEVKIKNYDSISSYSWKDIDHPTIYVPGFPPRFTPPNLPIQLQRPNPTRKKSRSPAAALDPLFQALLHQHPSFSMSPIHLVSDRNSLRNFLSFASNSSGKWRVDVEMINNTMFFTLWEEFRLMMINGKQDPGFGHVFEECVTRKEKGMEDSIHHERIVRYEMGGLECLVRFEADAYLNEDGDGENYEGEVDTSSDAPTPKPSKMVLKPPYKLVHVVSRGHNVDPDRIVEIKSCSASNFSMGKTLPQLWFAQTKHLLVGFHKEGLVTKEMEMRDMSEELQKWEESSQEDLRNMIRIIREIREIAQTARKCVVVCNTVDGVKCLSVYSRNGPGMTIRPEVVKRCWRTGGSAGAAPTSL